MKCPNCGYNSTPRDPVTFNIPIEDRVVIVEGHATVSSMFFYLRGDSWEDIDQAIHIIRDNELFKQHRTSVERYFKSNTAYVGIDMWR